MTTSHPSLDAEDQAILAGLKPEGAEPGTDPATGLPLDDSNDDANAPAPAPAPADAPAPAPAPTPAPSPAPADAPAPSPSPAPAAPAPSPAPAPVGEGGDPRAALRHARRNEKRLTSEVERLRQELEDVKAGKKGGGAGDELVMTDEELAELEENFPLQAKLYRETQELRKRLDAVTAPAPAPASDWVAPTYDPAVQEVIDQVPALQAWQFSQADQPKFQMAAEFDDSLRAHPLWKNKGPVERFAEAVRLTQEALGTSAPAPAPAPKQDPNAAIAAAPTVSAAGISDFRGGGTAAPPALDYSRMTDEQILHSLKPE